MAGVDRRLKRLEQHAGGAGVPFPIGGTPAELEDYVLELERRGWSIRDQCDEVMLCFWGHVWGGTRQLATDRQLLLVESLIEAGYLRPEWAERYFERMPVDRQQKHEAMLYSTREHTAAEVPRIIPLVREYKARQIA